MRGRVGRVRLISSTIGSLRSIVTLDRRRHGGLIRLSKTSRLIRLGVLLTICQQLSPLIRLRGDKGTGFSTKGGGGLGTSSWASTRQYKHCISDN